MEFDDSMRQVNSQFENLLYNGGLLGKAASIILCCVCLFVLIYALYMKIKRRWESMYYVILCACVFVWAICELVSGFVPEGGTPADILVTVQKICIALMPAFICMHVHLQVSYKEVHYATFIVMLIAPAFLILTSLRDILFRNAIAVIPAINDTQWYILLFYAYAVVCTIRSYLLCFNVFYQMPKHMRRSTLLILISVSAFFLLLILDILWTSTLSALIPENVVVDVLLPVGAPLAFLLLTYPLYSAMHLMPADDVIVTSREFVMGGLSTTILVLGVRKQILDWNRKDWGEGYPLPRPLYKEPIDVYRKRIVENNNCRISQHNNDIITAMSNGKEIHFLMRTREARSRAKRFGYVLEISDITPVYSIMRYYEEIANFDQLTRLHNRNAYISYVQQIVTEENLPLLIFIGDVNGLKQVNDIHGHIHGDELLRAVANIILRAAPPDAFLARVGGDEYVVLVPHGTEDAAIEFVQNVIAMCSETHNEFYGSPSISWGYAIMDSTEQSYNDVFEQADAMMYVYKKSRNMFSSSGLLPK